MIKSIAFAFVLGVAAFNSTAFAQSIALPASTSTFPGPRGYWFQAPVSFTITGASVVGAKGTQQIQIVKLASAPPAYNSGNPYPASTFTTLSFVSGPSTSAIALKVGVTAGDIIGVVGFDTGCSCVNYGTPNPFPTSVLGSAITLAKLDGNLTGGAANSLSTALTSFVTEPTSMSSKIGLIQLSVGAASAPVQAPPAPSGPAKAVVPLKGGTRAITDISSAPPLSGLVYASNPGDNCLGWGKSSKVLPGVEYAQQPCNPNPGPPAPFSTSLCPSSSYVPVLGILSNGAGFVKYCYLPRTGIMPGSQVTVSFPVPVIQLPGNVAACAPGLKPYSVPAEMSGTFASFGGARIGGAVNGQGSTLIVCSL